MDGASTVPRKRTHDVFGCPRMRITTDGISSQGGHAHSLDAAAPSGSTTSHTREHDIQSPCCLPRALRFDLSDEEDDDTVLVYCWRRSPWCLHSVPQSLAPAALRYEPAPTSTPAAAVSHPALVTTRT
ncbi:hypothetical protein PsYK624_119390 [Phanerochaete sordida]|uniref:Uncharacterized protein n=1 Tax=Phanerochaete sordida TaxID=48140 RepID=A0A9P3GHK6_9APHY|nr:hypothetical protein PsYK624_119390 [Phanerochaete sordida]